ncbi:STM4015 family protein [Streptomyces sp. NPDC048636]|uniref:STM4015 family protein n=1 Tax=Streptomyces sp. NPDC048636 TaxID=3155762 RepID=UPI003412ED02
MYFQELGTFASLPLAEFEPGSTDLPPTDTVAWRLSYDWKAAPEPFAWLWHTFLDTVSAAEVRAVVIGRWWHDAVIDDREAYAYHESARSVVDLLCASAPRLPALRGIFLGDVTPEESDLSFLRMCDVTPLLEAFPLLEEFTVRGCSVHQEDMGQLSFRPVRHGRLRALRFESGGLSGELVRNVAASELPRLEHLALWLGEEYYGCDATMADLAPILADGRFPGLRHLGLQNSEFQDEIAVAVASSPVVPRLTALDLSLGTLSDAGAEALLGGQPLNHLRRLNLHHHYLSAEMADRVRTALERHGVQVDLSDGQEAEVLPTGEVFRYVAVAE